VEAMAHSGVKKTHLPTPAAHAMKYINGLDIEVDSYRQLTENLLSVFGVDVYPHYLTPSALLPSTSNSHLRSKKNQRLQSIRSLTRQPLWPVKRPARKWKIKRAKRAAATRDRDRRRPPTKTTTTHIAGRRRLMK
jgi:hypothetical protein